MLQIRKVLKWLIPIVCFTVLLYVVDFSALVRIFTALSLDAIVTLMLISFLLILISAIKWKIFLVHLGGKVRLRTLYRWYLVGYFVNLILPSYLGGDAVRSFEIGKSVGQAKAAAATILERYTGFTAMLMLGCIAMNFSTLVTIEMKIALVGLLVAVIGLTFFSLNEHIRSLIAEIKALQFITRYFGKLAEAFKSVIDSPTVLFESYLLSILYHSITVLNVWACARAVGWMDPSFKGLFVVLPLILTLGALPISPQGFGIQEGAFYFFLTHLGATSEQAVGIALLLRAKSYVIAMVGSLFWLKGKQSTASLPIEAPEM